MSKEFKKKWFILDKGNSTNAQLKVILGTFPERFVRFWNIMVDDWKEYKNSEINWPSCTKWNTDKLKATHNSLFYMASSFVCSVFNFPCRTIPVNKLGMFYAYVLLNSLFPRVPFFFQAFPINCLFTWRAENMLAYLLWLLEFEPGI